MDVVPCSVLWFALLQVVGATLTPKIRGDINGAFYANFKKHQRLKLTGSPLKKFGVKNFVKCLTVCSAHTQCLSTNVNTKSDAEGLLGCELLGIDKYQYVKNLAKVEGVDHYALPSKCASSPCKNSGTCVPVYANNTYVCECPPMTGGTNCKKDCGRPLGMKDYGISDQQITASSIYNYLFKSYYGRLDGTRGVGCWQPSSWQAGQYLQIDLGSKKSIHKVATQGRNTGYKQWVTSFQLKYSDDGSTWTDYTVNGAVKIFSGNVNHFSTKDNVLPTPIMARYVRVVVQAWNGAPSLKVELYGC